MQDFGALFNDKTPKNEINAKVYRIVESDLEVATLSITNSLAEQSRLEELLEEIKPMSHVSKKHYLLTTPFRYPPLKYGSRYGTANMKSFFYGSKEPITCLYECAYYRFLFLNDIETQFEEPIQTNHLLFSCSVSTEQSLELTHDRFQCIRKMITHPSDYSFTQKIGSWAVENNFEVIKFPSARYKTGINYAIASINNIKSRVPKNVERLPCTSTPDRVVFKYNSNWVSIRSQEF